MGMTSVLRYTHDHVNYKYLIGATCRVKPHETVIIACGDCTCSTDGISER